MDSSLQSLIISAVIFAVAIAIFAIQAKHDNKMLSLWKIIEKFLLVRDFLSLTPLSDHDAILKMYPDNDFLSKTTIER